MPTPTNSRAAPICEGFIVQLSHDSGIRGARRIVTATLGRGWKVDRLAPKCREFEVLPEDGSEVNVSDSWVLAQQLEDAAGVSSAEPAFILPGADPTKVQVAPAGLRPKSSKPTTPKKCSNPTTWSLDQTRVFDAWSIDPPDGGKRYGQGIVIGHPDTGYTRHPEIFANSQILTSRGYDFEDGDLDARDPLRKGNKGHGTATASVIISPRGKQVPQNKKWVDGVAPKARLVPIRVSTSVVHISFRNVAKSIRHAADSGCHLISMSLGGPISYKYLRRSIDYAIGQGVIILAAAGNRWPFVVYPARYPDVIGVAACNCERKKWGSSASGKTVDMTAPGESVWVARTKKKKPRFGVSRGSGTSYAVATTAGACALWLAFHGRQKLIRRYGANRLQQVFQTVLKTKGVSRPNGWDTKSMGTGILDVKRLLKAALPARPPRPLAPKSASAMSRIADYFPGAGRRELAASLQDVFGVKGKALSAAVDEIVFHLVTNPSLRVLIEKSSQKGLAAKSKLRPSSTRLRVLRENPRLRRFASPALRANLESH